MAIKIHFLVFCIISLIAITACSSDLYHKEVDIKAEKGKDLKMVLDEIDRQDKFSIVRVKYTSGASVPSIMFLANGICEIGKKRGSKYCINLKEWTDDQNNWMYKIGYTSNKDINPYEYFGPDIDKSKELVFFVSKDCSVVAPEE